MSPRKPNCVYIFRLRIIFIIIEEVPRPIYINAYYKGLFSCNTHFTERS